MYPFDRNGYPIYPGCVVLNTSTGTVWVATNCNHDPNSWAGVSVALRANILWDGMSFIFGNADSSFTFCCEIWQTLPYLEIIERHVV